MSRSKKCEVKKVTHVSSKNACSPKKKSKKKHCKVEKKVMKNKIFEVICKPKNPQVVHVTTPPAAVNVQTSPPDIHITTPTPIVNVNTTPPDVHVKVEAPKAEVKVKVDLPDDESIEEMRDLLRAYRNSEIELFTSSGAGSGGEPPNRIGILERVGKTTFTLRPTTGNEFGHIAIYSISHITGFRPYESIGV